MASGEEEDPVAGRLADQFRVEEEPTEPPRSVTASLALIAAVLVAASTFSAVQTGHPGVALSFLAAVGLFVGTVTVYEAGRRLAD